MQVPAGEPVAWKAKWKPMQVGYSAQRSPQAAAVAAMGVARGPSAVGKSKPTAVDPETGAGGAPHAAPQAPSMQMGSVGVLFVGEHQGLLAQVREKLLDAKPRDRPLQKPLPTLVRLFPETSLERARKEAGVSEPERPALEGVIVAGEVGRGLWNRWIGS